MATDKNINKFRYGTNFMIVTLLVLSSFVMIWSFGPEDTDFSVAALTPRSVIRIDSDSDFTAANGVSSGAGTAGNPYIIKDWEIFGKGWGYCIYIGNTSKHVVIRNCILKIATGQTAQYYRDAGVSLYGMTNITIENCIIDGNTYGVYLEECSGFDISDNSFIGNSWGIDLENNYATPNKNFNFLDMYVDDNIFDHSTNNDVIRFNIWVDYNSPVAAYTVTIGDIKMRGNTFYMMGTTADGIDLGNNGGIGVYELSNGGVINIGDVELSDNDFYEGSDAIIFWEGPNIITDVTLTVGDIIIENNVCTGQTNYAIFTYPVYAGEYYGTTTATVGDLIIRYNDIWSASGARGIYVDDIYKSQYIEDTAKVTIGDIYIQYNNIYTNDYGIHLYTDDFGYYANDNAKITIGDIYVEDNEIYSTSSRSIYVYIYRCAYYMYINAQAITGDIYIRNNNLETTDDGIYIQYADTSIGYQMWDDSFAHLPDLIIQDNYIEAGSDGIYRNANYWGSNVNDNSYVYYGSTLIDNNDIIGPGSSDGIYFYVNELGDIPNDQSSSVMGDVTISNNYIYDYTSDGLYMYINNIGVFSVGTGDTPLIQIGNITVDSNVIIECGDGIEFSEYDFNAEEQCKVVAGDLHILDNYVFDSGGSGVYVDYNLDADDASTITMGTALISGNIIEDAVSNGVYLDYGFDEESGASIGITDIIIESNDIRESNNGINLEDGDWVTITNNSVTDCSYGIRMHDGENNTITYNTLNHHSTYSLLFDHTNVYPNVCHNNIVKNNSFARYGQDVYDESTNDYMNYWEWNFYQDYTGRDENSGTDPDGPFIGDTNLPFAIPGPSAEIDAHPRTKITTNDNSTWTYARLQDAVDNVKGTVINVAATTPGAGSQTIQQTGYYYEQVNVDDFNRLDLLGEGMDLTFVDGYSSGDVFDISDTDRMTFSDMTIQRGSSYGIDVNDDTNLDIIACNLTLNSDGINAYYDNHDDVRMLISNDTFDCEQPMIARDSNNNMHIVWVSEFDTSNDWYDEIYYSMYDNNGNLLIDDTIITPPNDGYYSMRPQVLVDSTNKVHIIWSDKRLDSDPILYYTKLDPYLDDRDGDKAVDIAIRLVDDTPLLDEDIYTPHTSDVALVMDSTNNIHIVWFDKDVDGLHYMRLNNNGNVVFGPTNYLTFLDSPGGSGSGDRYWPSIDLDSQNDLHIVWGDNYPWNDKEYDELHYMLLDPPTGNILINRTRLTSFDWDRTSKPTINVDTSNNVHVIFQDKGFPESQEIMYMKLNPGLDDKNGDAADINQIKIIDEKLLTPDDDEHNKFPFAVIDPQNNLHLVYYDDVWDGDIWYMKLNSNGNIISGPDWISLNDHAATNSYYNKVAFALDSSNQPHIVWCDDRGAQSYMVAYMPPGGWGTPDQAWINLQDSRFIDNSDDGFDLEWNKFDVDLDFDVTNTWFYSNSDNQLELNVEYVDNLALTVDRSIFQFDSGASSSDYQIEFETLENTNLDVIVTNSEFLGEGSSDGAGIHTTSSDIGYSDHIDFYIAHNKFESQYYGTYFDGLWCSDSYLEMHDNTFQNIGQDGIRWDGTDYLYGSEGPYQFIYDVQIYDNHFADISDDGFYLDDAYSENGYVLVNDNYFVDTGTAIYIDDTYGDLVMETNNNYIEYTDDTAIYYYGHEYGTVYWDAIGNYIATDDYDGIEVYYATYYSTSYFNWSFNTFEGCDDAIYIDEPEYGELFVDMYGNEMIGCDYGFYFEDAESIYAEINFIDGVMRNIDTTAFYLDCVDDYTSYLEFKIINTVVYGANDHFIEVYESADYGTTFHMEIRDCEFYSTLDYFADYFLEIEDTYEGICTVDIYNTRVIGWDDYCFYYYCCSDGPTIVNVYDSYFDDRLGDEGGEYDIYIDNENTYMNIYNTVGLNGVYMNNYPSGVSWYWYLDVEVLTGVNLDQPAPNVNVEVWDQYGQLVEGGLTDANGMTDTLVIMAKEYYSDYDDSRFYPFYTPHLVSASNGAQSASTIVDMDGANQKITIYLTGDADADGLNDLTDPDDDNDNITDDIDEFPFDPAEWQDTDKDGLGNNADTDDDNDGVNDTEDAFPTDPKEWDDTDGDGLGDNSDWDIDNDGWSNEIEEECESDPYNASSYPMDTDNDTIPDALDPDIDGDGYLNEHDDLPYDETEYLDTDGDGTGNNADDDDDNDGTVDTEDAFPLDPEEWNDMDNDGTGDNSDWDIDGDGWSNEVEVAAGSNPYLFEDTPSDIDEDDIADIYDEDIDGDGYPNSQDDFPFDPNEWKDSDDDGTGDESDTDIDGDGVDNDEDEYPTDPDEWADTDGDGTGDNADPDADGDGLPDDVDGDGIDNDEDDDIDGDGVDNDDDDFPNNPNEDTDTDGDGKGDNFDQDDDGDDYPDTNDDFPLDKDEHLDSDNDGIGDGTDDDIDGDGVLNEFDDLPMNPNEYLDTDGDGVGDNMDNDDDGDGVTDSKDAFPLNGAETTDTDGDGIGNNADDDDDGDGIKDVDDSMPLVPNTDEKTTDELAETREAQNTLFYVMLGILILIIVLLVVMMLKRGRGGAPSEKDRAMAESKPYEEEEEEIEEMSDDMVKCSECGSMVPADASECPSCGLSFEDDEEDIDDMDEEDEEEDLDEDEDEEEDLDEDEDEDEDDEDKDAKIKQRIIKK
jgi:parallel beta-helix repeat protein